MSHHRFSHLRPFIDGAFTDASSGQRFESINPANGEVLAEVDECDASDVDRAVQAADAAFPAWAGLSADERGMQGLHENTRYENVVMDISGEAIQWP